MIRITQLAAAALLAAVCLTPAAALAQPAATTQIAVLDGDAPNAYRAAGAVTVEIPIKAGDATLPKKKLDDMLRAEAAKLGADAVILVTYQIANPSTSSAANRASGVAIRYTTAQAVAAPAPVAPAKPAITALPQVAAVAPVPTPAVAPPPVPAPQPVIAAAVAPAAIPHATSADLVVLTASNLPGRTYKRLGPVNVNVHQKSMFQKQSEKDQLEEAMRKSAFKMGADAIIETTYKFTDGQFSKEGDTGTGVAVRFE